MKLLGWILMAPKTQTEKEECGILPRSIENDETVNKSSLG